MSENTCPVTCPETTCPGTVPNLSRQTTKPQLRPVPHLSPPCPHDLSVPLSPDVVWDRGQVRDRTGPYGTWTPDGHEAESQTEDKS